MQGRAFLGPASGPEREYVFGARDRMDERYDIIRAVRDKRYRYIRNYEPWKPYYQYMATPERGATMKELRRLHAEGKLNAAAELFMAERKPLEELYDLQADPHEIHNLIDSPEHAKTADRLREALERWQREILDLGFLPETEIVVREKEAGSRYAIFRREGGQALWERIREAAILAGRPEQSDRKALERLLDDSDAAVRYWGAIGLGNLGAAAAPARAALASALRDAASCVRIAAARALAAMGEAGEALPVLEAELSGAEEWARLAAAIALDEMGPAARPAQAAFERALEDSNKYVVRVAVHALEALQGDNA
ncbi:MAG: hypothetical protein BWZ10_03252 [candidate division BRC1 bacterium ADurb.BinA364]|nr:MAG: hypothetical protein BWZ10_03252 [candidate division BRC1 bacterium ADurb.BinA364]